MKTYSRDFYLYTATLNSESARIVAPLVRRLTPIRSVLDVGCATGHWLSAWLQSGVTDIWGVDGCDLDQEQSCFPLERFQRADLSQPLDLRRRFDLVQTLEVAEHLPKTAMDTFVDNLVRHGDVVLFSAAPPGQGGRHHVNEQPYEAWRNVFAVRGYALFDAVRPLVRQDIRVSPWYRYNMLLFANSTGQARLGAETLATRIADGAPVTDIAPLAYRIRKRMVACLPRTVQDAIAEVMAAQRGRQA